LSIIQAQINQYVQQDKSNVDLDKIANEMDDAENKDNVIESVVK